MMPGRAPISLCSDQGGNVTEVAGFERGIPGSRSATDPSRQLPRGRHDLPREFIAKTQRDRLIDAMARTVSVKGYAGAALVDVCSAAGVSTRAFYQHFADKETCFLAAFDRGVMLLQGAVGDAYSEPASWPGRIRRGLDELLRLLAAEPAFATLAVVEVLAAGPVARSRRRLLLEAYAAFFADAPIPPGAPDGVVAAVIAGVYGVIYDYVSTGRTAELPDRLPALTYLVVVPFLGPAAASAAAAGSLEE
jgi:AcrR family transcriptional regulator